MKIFGRILITTLVILTGWYLGHRRSGINAIESVPTPPSTSAPARAAQHTEGQRSHHDADSDSSLKAAQKHASTVGAPNVAMPPHWADQISKYRAEFAKEYPADYRFDLEGKKRLRLLVNVGNADTSQMTTTDLSEIKNFVSSVMTNKSEFWIVRHEALQAALKLRLNYTELERAKILSTLDSRLTATAGMTDSQLLKKLVTSGAARVQ